MNTNFYSYFFMKARILVAYQSLDLQGWLAEIQKQANGKISRAQVIETNGSVLVLKCGDGLQFYEHLLLNHEIRKIFPHADAIESAAHSNGLAAQEGETDIFIYPGFEFRAAGAMLTNFHLPRTSLLLLVCAFAGKELTLAAYRHAVETEYRFYSYGDCMLIV